MAKTVDIKKTVYDRIASVCQIHEDEVVGTVTWPYAVYALTGSDQNDINAQGAHNRMLEVDVYDHGKTLDTTRLENTTDAIDALLSAANLISETHYITLVRAGRLVLPTMDKYTRRRQLRYRIQIADKE